MKFSTRVTTESLFSVCHPAFNSSAITRKSNMIWLALAQHDPARLRFAHQQQAAFCPSSSMSWLELDINIVTTRTMAGLPKPADFEHKTVMQIDRKLETATSLWSGFRGIDLNATDVLAFPDPVLNARMLSRFPPPNDTCGSPKALGENENSQKSISNSSGSHPDEVGAGDAVESAFERELLRIGAADDSDHAGDDDDDQLMMKNNKHQQQELRHRPENCGAIFMCPDQMFAALGFRERFDFNHHHHHHGSLSSGALPPVTMTSYSSPSSQRMNNLDDYVTCALVHSILHIFGYQHDTDAERDEMVFMEKKVARAVGPF